MISFKNSLRLKKFFLARLNMFCTEKDLSKICNNYNYNGFRRFYLIHIRKTGGTSLNKMFLSLSGKDFDDLYNQLANKPEHRVIEKNLVFVGWNVRLINRGSYFYAFSHTPYHKLSLPSGTYTMTCFRDPVKRVLSHYNMLMDYHMNNIDHPCMKTEGHWLGNSFDDFLVNIPKHHLLNQLYMFSATYDVDEAVTNVKQLSHYFSTDNFNDGVDVINRQTGLQLEPIHTRKSGTHEPPSAESLEKLREMLDDEYQFLEKLFPN